jgi:glycine/D-amino acid oxidase-like deaminating enzyme
MADKIGRHQGRWEVKPGVAVVGAGIIGCLVARELGVRNPGTPVTLLDRDAVGAGASRRSAGLHLPRGASARTQRMSGYSHAYYADLAREHPEMPIYPAGATVVASPGLIGQYLPQAAPARVGALAAADVSVPPGLGIWRIAGSHYCDVFRLTQALALQLRPRVEVLEGVTVTGLLPSEDSVTVRCGTGVQLTVGGVVLSPGPWLAAPAWRDLLAPLGMRVKRIVALHIARQPTPADEVMLFDSDDAFLLPVVHRGHWLFSYSCREWDVDPDTPVAGLTAAHLSAARDCLRRYSPELADACRGGQLFCDAYSLDGEPVVRALDQAGRIVFAGAAGGSGYRLGPAIAAEAVDLLVHRSEGVTGDRKYV